MMRCERLSIPTSAGAEIALDVMCPRYLKRSIWRYAARRS